MSSFRKTIWNRIIDAVFGYDLFISYSRRGWSEHYAVKLAERLSAEPNGFRCFLDAKSLPTGDNWKLLGRRALRKSSKIVLLLTPGVVGSKGVEEELDYNSELRVAKQISLVNICGAWEEISEDHKNRPLLKKIANSNEDIEDVLRISEDNNTEPSSDVIEKIRNDFQLRTENSKRTRILVGALGVLSLLLVTAIILGELVRQQRNVALINESRLLSEEALRKIEEGDVQAARRLSLRALPDRAVGFTRPYVAKAEQALYSAVLNQRLRLDVAFIEKSHYISGIFLPKRQGIAVVSDDNVLRILDRNTGRELKRVKGTVGSIDRVIWSRDKRRFATILSDFERDAYKLVVWDVVQSKEIFQVPLKSEPFDVFAFSPDGKAVAVPQNADVIAVYDVATGRKPAFVMKDVKKGYTSAAFHSDNSFVFLGLEGGSVEVWNWRKKEKVSSLSVHKVQSRKLFALDNKPVVISISLVDAIGFWNWKTGAVTKIAAVEKNNVVAEVLDSRGRFLVMGYGDHTVRVWDLQTGSLIAFIRGHRESINDLAVSPNGQWVATASQDGTARLWDAKTGVLYATLGGSGSHVSQVEFDEDGKRVLTLDGRGLRVWNVDALKQKYNLHAYVERITQVAFSHDGSMFATSGENNFVRGQDSRIKIWEVHSGSLIRTIKSEEGGVVDLAFSEDDQRIITVSAHGNIRVWDVRNGKLLKKVFSKPFHSWGLLELDPFGRRLVVQEENSKDATLWDVANGKKLSHLVLSSGKEKNLGAFRARFSHNGKWLITVSRKLTSVDGRRVSAYSRENTIHLWNAKSGQFVNSFSVSKGRALGEAVSEDGSKLAVLSRDRVVRVWNVLSGQQIFKFAFPKRGSWRAMRLAISSDGRWIAASSQDSILVWDSVRRKLLETYETRNDHVLGLLFLKGSFLISQHKSAFRKWDMQSGRHLVFPAEMKGKIRKMSVSIDGLQRFIRSYGGRLQIWPVFSDYIELIQFAEKNKPLCVSKRADTNCERSGK